MDNLTDFARHLLRHKGDQTQEPERPAPVTLEPGCLIHWRGVDGTTRGPALLRGTFEDQGHVWAWFSFQEVEHLLRADLIVKVQGLEEL